MPNDSDQFAKSLLRDALNLVSQAETEVEVLAATQKIDVYAAPDPLRAAERPKMGLLGELSEDPAMFEAFSNTPGIYRIRRCLNKQLTWYHELDRRARAAKGTNSAQEEDTDTPIVAYFPWLVVLSTGHPETVLEAYACKEVRPGLYEAVPGLKLRIVVISELPRTRETVLLRLLGKGRTLVDALADIKSLPKDAWERSIAMPLLVHFRLVVSRAANFSEDNMSADIRALIKEYEQTLRNEGHKEGHKDGERRLLLRQLRARFGELPAHVVSRINAADVEDLERWGERILQAQTIDAMFSEPS